MKERKDRLVNVCMERESTVFCCLEAMKTRVKMVLVVFAIGMILQGISLSAFVPNPCQPKPSRTGSQRTKFLLKVHDATNNNDKTDSESTSSLANLFGLFGAEPCDLLSLKANEKGVRGIYVNRDTPTDQVLLRMPLEACLRDDRPPQWLRLETNNTSIDPPTATGKTTTIQGSSNSNDETDLFVSVEPWVTVLTASLLDLRFFNTPRSESTNQWLDLLPTELREILPIYWKDDLLNDSGSRELKFAVDTAKLARSNLVDTLLECLPRSDDDNSSTSNHPSISRSDVEDALDLVQTRSCRADSQNMRLLVPIVDMINHDPEPNARFALQDGGIVVRSTQDIASDNQVLIDYGASTRPAWRCLFSYGFVPTGEDVYESDLAEVRLEPGDGVLEVGPTELPYELVYYEAAKLGKIGNNDEDFEFDASIGQSIVNRLVATTQALSAEITGEDETTTAASRLIHDLKESNRRTLLASAGGLRDFLEETEE